MLGRSGSDHDLEGRGQAGAKALCGSRTKPCLGVQGAKLPTENVF